MNPCAAFFYALSPASATGPPSSPSVKTERAILFSTRPASTTHLAERVRRVPLAQLGKSPCRTMGFEIGNRANPGGRPRKTDEQIKFERQCREHSALFAIDNLKRWEKGDNPVASLAATREMLDRGFGRAVDVIEANVTSECSPRLEDVRSEIAALLAIGGNPSGPSDSKAPVDSGERAADPVPAQPSTAPVHSGDSAGGEVHSG